MNFLASVQSEKRILLIAVLLKAVTKTVALWTLARKFITVIHFIHLWCSEYSTPY